MSYQLNELQKLLKIIYSDTHQNIDWDPKKNNKVIFGGGSRLCFNGEGGIFEGVVPEEEGPTLVILEKGNNAFRDFITEVIKDDELKIYIEPSAVEKKLNDLLRKTKGSLPESDLTVLIKNEILKPLREEIRPWTVYIPIDNLIVQYKLKIGSVTFLSKQDAKKELDVLFSEHQYGGTVEKQAQQRDGVNIVLDQFYSNSKTYAKVMIRAHATKGTQRATEVAYVSINALRAFTHLLYSHNMKAYFGLPTEIQNGNWLAVLCGDDNNKGFTIDFNQRHSLVPFELNNTNIEKLNKYYCFSKIQQILATLPNKRRDIEVVVIQGLQAIGKSVVAPTIDMKFLNCTTALERLLIASGEETTTERFTDRLTLILTEDTEIRLRVRDKAKNLYDKRSKIVHAAFFGIEEEDYLLFEKWAITILIYILKNLSKYESHKAFCVSIDELKY